MSKIMNMLFLSCKKATFLMEKEHTQGLNHWEKARLSLHNALCDACSAYRRQSALMEKALKKWTSRQKLSKKELSKEEKKQLIRHAKDLS